MKQLNATAISQNRHNHGCHSKIERKKGRKVEKKKG
jgi:hypothetical protein